VTNGDRWGGRVQQEKEEGSELNGGEFRVRRNRRKGDKNAPTNRKRKCGKEPEEYILLGLKME